MAIPSIAWQKKARCRNKPSDLFFAPIPPDGEESTWTSKEAKKICKTCPVKLECLEYARENKEMYGVWGGRDFGEKRRFLKQLQQEKECPKPIKSPGSIREETDLPIFWLSVPVVESESTDD